MIRPCTNALPDQWLEKGRAGGRARQPARPLAWSRSKHLETTFASGVASYKVECGDVELYQAAFC